MCQMVKGPDKILCLEYTDMSLLLYSLHIMIPTMKAYLCRTKSKHCVRWVVDYSLLYPKFLFIVLSVINPQTFLFSLISVIKKVEKDT